LGRPSDVHARSGETISVVGGGGHAKAPSRRPQTTTSPPPRPHQSCRSLPTCPDRFRTSTLASRSSPSRGHTRPTALSRRRAPSSGSVLVRPLSLLRSLRCPSGKTSLGSTWRFAERKLIRSLRLLRPGLLHQIVPRSTSGSSSNSSSEWSAHPRSLRVQLLVRLAGASDVRWKDWQSAASAPEGPSPSYLLRAALLDRVDEEN